MTSQLAQRASADQDDFIHDPPEGVDVGTGWQERAYWAMHGPEGWGLDIGMGRHPDAGSRGSYSGYACWAKGGRQVNIRAAGPLKTRLGIPDAEPFNFEMVEPDKVWRLQLGDNPELEVDVTFEARTATWRLPKAELEDRQGKKVASTQVNFQSGIFNGTIRAGDDVVEVNDWRGTRDRTWGVRRYEGRLRSGMMIAAMLELPDHALYLWSIERRTGELVYASGARCFNDGTITPVDSFEFELELGDEETFQAADGVIRDANGEQRLRVEYAGSTVYLAGGGYLEKGRHGQAAEEVEVHTDTWDTADPAVRRAVTGLDDHVVTISGDQEGAGIFELQLGKHEKYLPGGWESDVEGVADLGTRRLR